MMIGDNFVTDIEGAQQAGMKVIFFNAHPERFTPPHPVDWEVHTLSEIKEIL